MKLLLDSCVWGGALSELQNGGHDVIWSGNWDEDPGDEVILDHANSQERVLVTLDKDFGELAIVHERPHYGIIRLVNIAARRQAAVCQMIITNYQSELTNRAIITVSENRVRIRLRQLDPP